MGTSKNKKQKQHQQDYFTRIIRIHTNPRNMLALRKIMRLPFSFLFKKEEKKNNNNNKIFTTTLFLFKSSTRITLLIKKRIISWWKKREVFLSRYHNEDVLVMIFMTRRKCL